MRTASTMILSMVRLLLILSLCSFSVACGPDDVALDGLVFNEVSLVGGDYIELMNIGDGPIDLGGYRLVDRVDGAPRPDQAVVFDVGATLAAGEILLIQAKLGMDVRPGEQTACGPGAPMRCYYAAWGLSNTTGDALYILSPEGVGLLELEYAAGTVSDGAWGRLPDGTGPFANTANTPGQSNAAFVAP